MPQRTRRTLTVISIAAVAVLASPPARAEGFIAAARAKVDRAVESLRSLRRNAPEGRAERRAYYLEHAQSAGRRLWQRVTSHQGSPESERMTASHHRPLPKDAPAEATRADTTYRAGTMGRLGFELINRDHVSTGDSILSVAKGDHYRIGFGKLSVRIPTSLGRKMEDEIARRAIFGDQNVHFASRMANGRTVEMGRLDGKNIQTRTTEVDGRTILTDTKQKMEWTTHPDGRVTERALNMSGPYELEIRDQDGFVRGMRHRATTRAGQAAEAEALRSAAEKLFEH